MNIILPTALVDYLVTVGTLWLGSLSYCWEVDYQNANTVNSTQDAKTHLCLRSIIKAGSGGTFPPLVGSQSQDDLQFLDLGLRFLWETQFCDWSLVLPVLSTHCDCTDHTVLSRMSRHNPTQRPYSSWLVRLVDGGSYNDLLRKLMMWVNYLRVSCLVREGLGYFATFHRLLEIHLPFSDQGIWFCSAYEPPDHFPGTLSPRQKTLLALSSLGRSEQLLILLLSAILTDAVLSLLLYCLQIASRTPAPFLVYLGTDIFSIPTQAHFPGKL